MVEIKREAGLAWIALSLFVGDLVIYTLGTLQLALVAHLSPAKAILLGVVPFLLGEAIKLVAAALISVKLRKSFRPLASDF
jgi:biotin transport system substrate-specific component